MAVWAIPGYAVLPAVTEWVVEGGHTLAYTRVDSVGLPKFIAYFAAYMACIEVAVYWTHRILHEHRPSYRHVLPWLLAALLAFCQHWSLPGQQLELETSISERPAPESECNADSHLASLTGGCTRRLLHYIHHKYNKEHTLSPFAGLAFHPVDGVLQVLAPGLTTLCCCSGVSLTAA